MAVAAAELLLQRGVEDRLQRKELWETFEAALRGPHRVGKVPEEREVGVLDLFSSNQSRNVKVNRLKFGYRAEIEGHHYPYVIEFRFGTVGLELEPELGKHVLATPEQTEILEEYLRRASQTPDERQLELLKSTQ